MTRTLLLAAAVLLAAAPAPAAKPKKAKKPSAPAAETRVPPGPPLYTRSTATIEFIWPPEGMSMSGDGEFVFGSVIDPKAPFTINGVAVTPHKDGGFLAWLPVHKGTFTFRAELALSTVAVAERHILIAAPPPPMPPGKPQLDEGSLWPRAEQELRAGDWLAAHMRGAPGHPARFRAGKGPWRPMRESSPGSYDGLAQIAPGETFDPAPLEYELGSGWSSVRAKSPASVSAPARPPLLATVKPSAAGFANVKVGPQNGFLLFPLPGTKLAIDGRDGSYLRVRLAEGLSGWIEAKDVDPTPVPAAARAVTGNVGVAKSEQGAVLRVSLSERAPYSVEAEPERDRLTVRIYGALHHTNWVINEASDFVREVRLRQESSDVVAVTVLLEPGRGLWGWWPTPDAGGLRIELRAAPRVNPKRPLQGIRVFLDPGHMPSAPGAIGPLGTKEMDANLAIAQAAKARFEKEGAAVTISRSDPQHELGLVDRPRLAVERGADLFISIHNNGIPDGQNPFSGPRGFEVYYYHPQSLALGRAMEQSYRRRVKLPDGGLKWGNLLVARLPAVPAILVESAYMPFPDQEAMLNDAGFRDELGEALVAGTRDFLESVARSQSR